MPHPTATDVDDLDGPDHSRPAPRRGRARSSTGSMRALTVPETGGLRVVEAPLPGCGRGQVLVDVAYSAVNDIDVAIRDGGYARQARRFRRRGPVVTGIELSGVVRTPGHRLQVGQRVIGYSHVMDGPRTHAEVVAMAERDLQVIPDSLSDEAAAALVTTGLTSIDVLERLRPVGRGDSVLVIGAAGGLGAAAVQLASSRGATVVAVASAAHENWLVAIGADEVRPSREGSWWRPGDAFDLVLDAPAVSGFAAAAPHLAPRGTYVTTNPQRDLAGFARARLSRRRAGFLLVLRSNPARMQRLVDLATEGTLIPVIDSVHDLAHADTAFTRFAARGRRGRVLLGFRP